jgi:DUF3048 family protein
VPPTSWTAVLGRRHLSKLSVGVALSTAALLAASCSSGSKSTSSRPATAPLTGLVVPSVPQRPALSIKIDNSPPGLPQSGLDKADIVTDALVEGGLTRLLATYQSQDATQVGPIRSARPVDAALLRQLGGGIFAYSGAAAGEIAPVKAESTATLLSFDAGNSAFKQLPGHPVPFQVYASTTDLYSAGQKAGASTSPPKPIFTYNAAVPKGSSGVTARIPMSTLATVTWTWDPTTQSYVRSQNGKADVLSDGSRISATDVVVLSTAIGKTGIFDSAGNEDPLVIVVGSGPATVLRNGQAITGTWTRNTISDTMKLTDASGATIALQPGRSWIELQPRPLQPAIS